MTDIQIYITLGIFLTVILVIAINILDMMIAALLGVCLMIVFDILNEHDMIEAVKSCGGSIALLFGGMVVAHVLSKTGLFERLSAVYLQSTRGSGKRYLLILVFLVAPVCAFLPNATTVILLAPVIIHVAKSLNVDFVGPMVLTAIVSNSAGMLTLVGDPATYIVGSSIGMTFGEYLRKVSLGGLLSVLVVIPLLPRLLPDIWHTHYKLPSAQNIPPIERPGFVFLALGDLALMVLLFLFGEKLPFRIGPPTVAIVAATLALLVVYSVKVEPVDEVIQAVDWKTLLFLGAIFFLVRGFVKTGLLQAISLKMHGWFGSDFMIVAMVMLVGIAILSSILANIPVVAASLTMIIGYLVATEVVPETAFAAGFIDWPANTMPIFIAMMFGATLGGNATMIGSSANVVTVGICASQGRRVSFAGFSRYGLPLTAAQLMISALYVLILAWII